MLLSRTGSPLATMGRRAAALSVMVGLSVLAGVAGVAGLGGSSWAAGKGGDKSISSMKATFDAALDANKPAVIGCVMTFGISQGVPSVKIEIKVLINRQGQVFGLDLDVIQQGGDRSAMKECVKKAIALTHFPSSRNSLTELHRQWTFATR